MRTPSDCELVSLFLNNRLLTAEFLCRMPRERVLIDGLKGAAAGLTVCLRAIALWATVGEVGHVVGMIEMMTTLIVSVSRASAVETEPFVMPMLVLSIIQPSFRGEVGDICRSSSCGSIVARSCGRSVLRRTRIGSWRIVGGVSTRGVARRPTGISRSLILARPGRRRGVATTARRKR